MKISELMRGKTLAEDVGPGRDWDPHSMGAPGSVPPFAGRGFPGPTPPVSPVQNPMQAPGKAADASGVGPGRDWDPHSMGSPGSVPPFAPRGMPQPGQPQPMQPANPMPMPAQANAMPAGNGLRPPSAPTPQPNPTKVA